VHDLNNKHFDDLKKYIDDPDFNKPGVDAPDKRKLDGDKDKDVADKDKTDQDKSDEDKIDEHAKEVAAATTYIAAEDAKEPSPDPYTVLAVINRTPGMKIPGKPYQLEKNPKGEGHYNIYFNPNIYFDYTEGYFGKVERDFDPTKDDRFAELSTEEGKTRPSDKLKGEKEAIGILKAENKGLVSNPRRPAKGGPDLDFQIDGPAPYKWCDIKTPVDPKLRELKDQVTDIANNISGQKAGSNDVMHVVDLINVPLDARADFMDQIIKLVGSPEGIKFVD
jgi:hypothetical protein